MRAGIVTAALILTFGATTALAQGGRGWEGSRVNRPAPQGHSHGHEFGHGHIGGHDHFGHGHGHTVFPPYLSGYGGYGYGGYGYELNSLGIYGSGLGYYRGPAAFSGITPPVYVYPPFGYGYGYGYGYGGYGLPDRYGDTGYYLGFGPTYGYGTSYAPGGQMPFNSPLQQYQYQNDWSRLSAELADRALRNVDEPRAGTSAVPTPSTPEARIKSARYEAMGDEAFANQEYAKVLGHYKTATGIAKDNGAPFLKAGYAYVVLGRFESAIESFRRVLAVDPAVAATGPTPDEMYGEQQIAWTAHLGRATRWVAEDVAIPSASSCSVRCWRSTVTLGHRSFLRRRGSCRAERNRPSCRFSRRRRSRPSRSNLPRSSYRPPKWNARR